MSWHPSLRGTSASRFPVATPGGPFGCRTFPSRPALFKWCREVSSSWGYQSSSVVIYFKMFHKPCIVGYPHLWELPYESNIWDLIFVGCWDRNRWSSKDAVLSRLAGQGRGENRSPTAIFPLLHTPRHPTVGASKNTSEHIPQPLEVSPVFGDAVAQGAILLQIDERSGRVSWSGDKCLGVSESSPNLLLHGVFPQFQWIFLISPIKIAICRYLVSPTFRQTHVLSQHVSSAVSPQPQPHRIPLFFLGQGIWGYP